MLATRRAALFGAMSLGPLALAGCTGTPLTPAQIITIAQSAVSGLTGMLKGVASQYPNVIPASMVGTLTNVLTLASGAATTLSNGLPATAGASTVHVIEGYINDVLNTLAGPPVNGLIPAPFNMVLGAAAFVVPQLEAFAAIYIPAAAASPATAQARAKLAAASPMPITSTAQALAVLNASAAMAR